MSALGTIADHMRAGLDQSEAARLEALLLRCDKAAEAAAALDDDELLRYTIDACQGCIDVLTASFFVERRLRALQSAKN